MELAIRRFDFDGLQDFAAPPPPVHVANDHTLPEAEEIAPPPPPSFSEEELKAAKAVAFEEGKQAGIAEEAARKASEAEAQDQQANKAVAQVLTHTHAMLDDWAAFKQEQTKELGALVMMLLRKVAGDALELAPQNGVEKMIDECLGVLQTQPKIIVQVHPAIFSLIEEKLRVMAEQNHLENTITLKSNVDMHPSEARLDWGSGSAERNLETIWSQIEQMMADIDFAQLASETEITLQKSPAQQTEKPEAEYSESAANAESPMKSEAQDLEITNNEQQQGEDNE